MYFTLKFSNILATLKDGKNSDILSNKQFGIKDIKLIIFYDGVSFSTSTSSNSHNAVLCSIANLPLSLRNSHKNIITCYLTKPDLNINHFMFKHSTDLMQILNEGINLENIGLVNISFVGFTGDTPATAEFCMHKGFNGFYGCLKCLCQGTRYENRVFIYPYCPQAQVRTNELYEENAQEAYNTGLTINGIKGKCWLSYFLDLPNGIIIDYMHLILEGTLKKTLSMWFNSIYHKSGFYLGIYF